ncbi:MAG: zinc metallopeptidase [Clostridiales bacterium]|jgi:Zn-dependent membrane protease YugP|nr:zinc metallopeptidase [Clostridiales bacterium]
MLLVLPAILLSLWAQFKVSSAYKKYSQVNNRRGFTGAEVAKQLLAVSGIRDVRIEPVHGQMTDHYDPGSKVLRLSEGVYGSASLAAAGIAAHETGHAIQHNLGYGPLGLRSTLVPAANIGSRMAMPLIIIGLLLSSGSGSFGLMMVYGGIILYSIAVLFTLITLPVEFNASSRAMELLSENRILAEDEVAPTKKVLSAAAMTYVASALTAVLTLLRFILLSNRRR